MLRDENKRARSLFSLPLGCFFVKRMSKYTGETRERGGRLELGIFLVKTKPPCKINSALCKHFFGYSEFSRLAPLVGWIQFFFERRRLLCFLLESGDKSKYGVT
jgi:hypothetical protein